MFVVELTEVEKRLQFFDYIEQFDSYMDVYIHARSTFKCDKEFNKSMAVARNFFINKPKRKVKYA